MRRSERINSNEHFRKRPLSYGIYGPSGSGKTTLIEELITGLNERGFKVASIKHTRGEFSLDEKGKDTWRHRKAGAELTVFSTPIETTYIKVSTDELNRILQEIPLLGNFDIVLVEGFTESNIPKIAVGEFKAEEKTARNTVLQYNENKKEILEHLTRKIEIHRIAMKLPGLNCGDCGFDSCWEMAEAIREGKKKFKNCQNLPSRGIELEVNGKNIPLSGFPSRIIRETVTGMLNALKGVSNPKNITLTIKEIKEKGE